MKSKSYLLAIPLAAAALVGSARAIEAPVDDAPPPAAEADAEVQKDKPAQNQNQVARAAFLGVVTTELPEMLRDHLGIKDGEGIIVRSVMPDGPAQKAGIEANDVITRVADKPVASAADLSAQIATHNPGDKVSLDLVHKGKPARMEVVLAERPDELAAMPAMPLEELQLDGIPGEMAGRLRRMLEGNAGGFNLPLNPQGEPEILPDMENAMNDIKERLEKAMGGIQLDNPNIGGDIQVHQGATIKIMDEHGSVEVKSNEDSKEVTVRDKDNNVTWTGPWDSPQDKAAAPDDVRNRVERLNLDGDFKGNGLRLRIGPNGFQPE